MEVDDSAEERKGGAGNLGKLFLTADATNLLMYFHVPKALSDKLSLKEWADAILPTVHGKIIEQNDEFIKAESPADKENERFPLKMRSVVVVVVGGGGRENEREQQNADIARGTICLFLLSSPPCS